MDSLVLDGRMTKVLRVAIRASNPAGGISMARLEHFRRSERTCDGGEKRGRKNDEKKRRETKGEEKKKRTRAACVGYTRYCGILKSGDPTRAMAAQAANTVVPLSKAHTRHCD